jgi:phosphohistidine phosphatase SixA
MSKRPTQNLLIMRHAEKPDDDIDPNLSPAGVARAQALATYIPQTFGTPNAIIAAADSKKSVRPRKTVEPLARQCGLAVQTPYADKQYAEQAAKLLDGRTYPGSLIVVCWHHEDIPQLMAALGAAAGSYPLPWNPAVFNLILQTGLQGDGAITVAQVLEPF